jgi:spoIIIJ-associated protein
MPASDSGPRAGSAEPSVGKAAGTLSPVGDFVLGLVERLEAGPFELAESGENETIAIRLSGAAAQAIAAGDARTIDAIQLLANQVSMREGDDAKRVVVEAEGDLARREEYLARLAERAASRATETGRSVAIDPMSPRDRRIVHVALRDTDGIATMSVGSGEYRQVVVVPERAPEYAEAQRQAAASSSRRDE